MAEPKYGIIGFAETLKERDRERREREEREARREEPLELIGSFTDPIPELQGPRLPGGEFFSSDVPMQATIPAALMEVINDERIIVTKEMLPIINDPEIVVTRGGQPAKKLSGRDIIRSSGQFSRANILPNLPKKKRKVSKYQKEFGRQLKKLKAKHPRTKIKNLMKRAHTATRKALK